MFLTLIWGMVIWAASLVAGSVIVGTAVIGSIVLVLSITSLVWTFKALGGFSYPGELFEMQWANAMYSLVGIIPGAAIISFLSVPIAFGVLISTIIPGAIVMAILLTAFLVKPMKLVRDGEWSLQDSL